MRTPQDIIISPIVTEHSLECQAQNKYTFKVATDANKIEIAKAVRDLFGVEVKGEHNALQRSSKTCRQI